MLEYFNGHTFMSTVSPDMVSLWGGYVPADGITLLYGPPGVGKSLLAWTLMNAMHQSTPLFGAPVCKGRALLLCVDMSARALRARWESIQFTPMFDIIVGTPFSAVATGFLRSPEYMLLKNHFSQQDYSLLVIDALGEVHLQSAVRDDIPAALYGIFRHLAPHSALLFLHHDRKQQMGDLGYSAPNDEDALGSQLWKAYATSTLHIYQVNAAKIRLKHTKSQVAEKAMPLDLYINEEGYLEEWNPHVDGLAAQFAPLRQAYRAAGNNLEVLAKRSGFSYHTLTCWFTAYNELQARQQN